MTALPTDLAWLWGVAQAVGVLCAPVVVWLATTRLQWRGVAVQERGEQTRTADSISSRLNALVDQVQAERDHWALEYKSLGVQLEQLRQARYGLEDMVLELRDAAVAARVMVHERERRLGLAETEFGPLPFPGLMPRTPPPV